MKKGNVPLKEERRKKTLAERLIGFTLLLIIAILVLMLIRITINEITPPMPKENLDVKYAIGELTQKEILSHRTNDYFAGGPLGVERVNVTTKEGTVFIVIVPTEEFKNAEVGQEVYILFDRFASGIVKVFYNEDSFNSYVSDFGKKQLESNSENQITTEEIYKEK